MTTALRPYRSMIFFSLAVVYAIALVTTPPDADRSLTIATYSLMALSVGMAFGQGGLFAGAQAAFAALGGYATAIITTNNDVSAWVGLPAAIVVPAVIAWLLARAIIRLSPLALGLATVTVAQLITVVLNQGGTLTGGYIGISGIPQIPGIDSRYRAQVLAWAGVFVVGLIYVRFQKSMQGLGARTIKFDSILAESVGIAVVNRLSSLFALGCGIAGFSGWLYAHSRSYLSPESLPLILSVLLLMMVVVGGSSTVTGPVVGAILFTLLRDELPGDALQNFYFGVVLLVSIIAFPKGLTVVNWSGLVRLKNRVMARRSERNEMGGSAMLSADAEVAS